MYSVGNLDRFLCSYKSAQNEPLYLRSVENMFLVPQNGDSVYIWLSIHHLFHVYLREKWIRSI